MSFDLEKWLHTNKRGGHYDVNGAYLGFRYTEESIRRLLTGKILCDAKPVAQIFKSKEFKTAPELIFEDRIDPFADQPRYDPNYLWTPLYRAAKEPQ